MTPLGSLILPKLIGMTYPVVKEAINARTIIQTSTSGKEVRINPWSASLPIWKFTMTFEFLSQRQPYGAIGQVPPSGSIVSLNPLMADDRQALQGFILSVGGSWDTWLFDDPNDDAIVRTQIGVGDGVNVAFQIVRYVGSYAENIQNINGTPIVAADWAPGAAFALNGLAVPTQTGMLTQQGPIFAWQTPGWPNYFKCTTAGTTGPTEPNWRLAPMAGLTVTDGTAVWTNMGVPLIVYRSASNVPPDYFSGTVYTVGSVITPATSNAGGFSFVCTTAGTSTGAVSWGQIIGSTTSAGGGTVFSNLGVLPIGATGYPIVPQHPARYTVGATGLVSFISNIPVAAAQISITSGFYFRCRFSEDSASFEQFMANFFELKQLNFVTVKI